MDNYKYYASTITNAINGLYINVLTPSIYNLYSNILPVTIYFATNHMTMVELEVLIYRHPTTETCTFSKHKIKVFRYELIEEEGQFKVTTKLHFDNNPYHITRITMEITPADNECHCPPLTKVGILLQSKTGYLPQNLN
jgi:hypothetical protein